MSFRITTNMSMNSYRYNLNKVNTDLNSSRDKVLTQRNFNSFSEDPAAATQSFRLRRSYWQTSTHLSNCTDTYQKFNAAWTALGTVVDDLTDQTAHASSLLATNGTAGSSRATLGQTLQQTAKSVVQMMNTQYGEQYVFSGTNGLTVPFSWGENGELLYRGIDVNSKSDSNEYALLDKMASETQYIDLGMGIQEDSNGKTINGSAFNMALPGIDILGYGVDDDGDPKNIASLMYKLGEIFSKCDNDSGSYASEQDAIDAERLVGKLKIAQDELTKQYVDLDTKAQFLTTNKDRLTDQQTTLNEQILEVEQADLADAITEFSWQQYCYNAALKVGNQLLSQSLIDYMN